MFHPRRRNTHSYSRRQRRKKRKTTEGRGHRHPHPQTHQSQRWDYTCEGHPQLGLGHYINKVAKGIAHNFQIWFTKSAFMNAKLQEHNGIQSWVRTGTRPSLPLSVFLALKSTLEGGLGKTQTGVCQSLSLSCSPVIHYFFYHNCVWDKVHQLKILVGVRLSSNHATLPFENKNETLFQ